MSRFWKSSKQSLVALLILISTNNYNVIYGFSINTPSATAGKQQQQQQQATETQQIIEWDVYVDQSKSSISKGSTDTLESFLSLAPPSVKVHAAMLPSAPRRSKSPLVRCRSRNNSSSWTTTTTNNNNNNNNTSLRLFEVTNVDSLDKVYRILKRHMRVKGVNATVCECMKWKEKGNGHMMNQQQQGEISLAIDAYTNALNLGFRPQEGILLMLRAKAYQKRANIHRDELKTLVREQLTKSIPDTQALVALYKQTQTFPAIAPSVMSRVETYTRNQEQAFMVTKNRHGLYQYALLHAAQDALRATQLLPHSPRSWLVAASILDQLLKFPESLQYYKKAVQIDPGSLATKIEPEMERIQNRQKSLERAIQLGWSEDMLRLAFDVGSLEE